MTDKAEIREQLRQLRREHVANLPGATRALLFRRPPAQVMAMLEPGITVGLYRPGPTEAPTGHYARFLVEEGYTVALPRFETRGDAMEFACHTDPFGESDLETGPFGIMQPRGDAERVDPAVVFVPLLGFTGNGDRIGQGGGHYDRWLAAHPDAMAIGMAWDAQKLDTLPTEPHDIPMRAVVTPTRLYGPF